MRKSSRLELKTIILLIQGYLKITELTLDRFENNYRLFVQKLADVESNLVIRAILLKTMKLYTISAIKFKVLKMYKMLQLLLQIKCANNTLAAHLKVTL